MNRQTPADSDIVFGTAPSWMGETSGSDSSGALELLALGKLGVASSLVIESLVIPVDTVCLHLHDFKLFLSFSTPLSSTSAEQRDCRVHTPPPPL